MTTTTTIKATSADTAGNVEATRSWPVRIDTVGPSTPILCNAGPCSSAGYTAPVTVTLPATDAGGSGLARTRYTTDGTDPATSATAVTYTGPFTVSRTTTVRAFSVDNAGNVEPAGNQLIQVDTVGGTTGGMTLSPTDDGYTSKNNPTASHGSEGSLNVNSGAGERRSYLKFDVTGIPAGATGVTATLRLYAQSSASTAVTFTASRVATDWTEATLAWTNQPAIDAAVTTKAGLTNGTYNRFDVSTLVTGNGSYAMVITDNNSTQRYFSSKESSSSLRPQLVLSWNAPPG